MADEGVSPKLDAIADVDIDSDGRFKYILIKVMDEINNFSKHIVRGYEWAEYHADIFENVSPGIEALGLRAICVGGGRIYHKKEEKSLLVYGYSMGFGRADHSITVEKLKNVYSDYKSITFSNEGY